MPTEAIHGSCEGRIREAAGADSGGWIRAGNAPGRASRVVVRADVAGSIDGGNIEEGGRGEPKEHLFGPFIEIEVGRAGKGDTIGLFASVGMNWAKLSEALSSPTEIGSSSVFIIDFVI